MEAGDYEKALAFNTEAYEYDDEDSITLDNLAQTYYRLGNDKAKAREFFQKAIELKPTQIDTLYFLAQYDIEEGNRDAAREKLEKALKGRFSPSTTPRAKWFRPRWTACEAAICKTGRFPHRETAGFLGRSFAGFSGPFPYSNCAAYRR